MQRLGQLNDARFDMVRRDGVKTEPKERLWGIRPEKVGFTRLNQHPPVRRQPRQLRDAYPLRRLEPKRIGVIASFAASALR